MGITAGKMDLQGAALAAFSALAALDLASQWFNFSEDERRMMSLFVLAMFTFVSATSVSVLRLTSRFNLYARILVAVAVARFLLSVGQLVCLFETIDEAGCCKRAQMCPGTVPVCHCPANCQDAWE